MRRQLSSVAPAYRDGDRGRPVLLVVDDDAGVRESLSLILGDEYAVREARGGREALNVAHAERIDLVLLDLLMPEVDGLEVLQELKALEPDLPVIVVTAVKTVRTTVAAMKLGASDYITKPFQEEELLATIRRALERHASSTKTAAADRVRRVRAARPPGPHRLLITGGDPGWRATLAVALARAAAVETSATLIGALNRMLKLRPTCVVLNVADGCEAGAFLTALQTQLPACPVLVVSDDAYLGGASAWETLLIRAVIRPSADPGELVSQIFAVIAPGRDPEGQWPHLGWHVSRAIEYVGTHFDDRLTVVGLARRVDISASRLAHLFRAETGMSVRNYLTNVRVMIARDLLEHTDEKLESIAARVGFVDTSHLARALQRITGRPPSAYRRAAG